MSVTQQISTIIEQLPPTEQNFIFELVKKLSISYKFSNTAIEVAPQRQALLQRQKATVKRLIESINADPLLDDPLDEILNQRINITRELDL